MVYEMSEDQKERIASMIVRYDHREDRNSDAAISAKKDGNEELAKKFRHWARLNATRVAVIEDVLDILGYYVYWVDDDHAELRAK